MQMKPYIRDYEAFPFEKICTNNSYKQKTQYCQGKNYWVYVEIKKQFKVHKSYKMFEVFCKNDSDEDKNIYKTNKQTLIKL